MEVSIAGPSMPHALPDLADALLTAAKAAGADQADAIAIDGKSLSVDVLNGHLEHAERSESVEVGLRVLIGQKQACVSSSLIDRATLKEMAERAVAMAAEAPDDPFVGLADAAQLATDPLPELDLYDESDPPEATVLEERARAAEAAALAVDGVSKTQSASAGYGRSEIFLAASNGFARGYKRSDCGLSCVAIAGDSTEMERDYFGESRIYHSDLPSPEEVGRTAGARAASRFGARKPKTGAFPVVFDERIASSLVGHLVVASNGSMVARGSSWLMDALGEQVLPKGMSLEENPHRARVSGSRPFDAEGLPTRRRMIVEDGVLQGWTLDLANARRLDMASTANASRNVSSPPSPSVSNLMLTQGERSRDELLADMGTGLLVTSMIGSTINPNTGDYSRGASGFWVENGEVQYPVNECTIAGNLRDMLKTLVPANDARTHLSRVVPSLLVEGLTLAGD